jgi:hypothetical protein
MDKLELVQLVTVLYAAIPGISDYKVPAEMPDAHVLPRSVLQDLVCGGPCHIQAIYHPDFGLMIGEALTNGDIYERSILFHELVHHAQHSEGKFNELHTACERRAVAEQEAYALQSRNLAASGYSQPVRDQLVSIVPKQQAREIAVLPLREEHTGRASLGLSS